MSGPGLGQIAPPGGGAGGGLTDAQLRASPVPVSGTFYQTTQPVSIAANVAVTGTFWQATQPVSGTFWQATQPVSIAGTVAVSGPLTDTQLRAVAVPVSGTFWQATQPVSGPLTDTQLRAVAVPVSGSFFQATQPVSIAATVSDNLAQVAGTTTTVNEGAATAGSQRVVLATQSNVTNNPTGVVSLGNSLGKAWAGATGNLVTTAVTADQVIVTYTVTAGKTFYLQGVLITARLTTFATTATFFGACSVETPSGTKKITLDAAGAGIVSPPLWMGWDGEPQPIAAGTVIRVVCTPSAVTSFTWKAVLYGYEK